MLSNKLTFSLGSIVMGILAFAFLATPAMAQVVALTPPANGFNVISESAFGAENGIQATAGTRVDGGALPDLENLLRIGGALQLSIAVSDAAANDANFTVKTTSTAADIAKLKHRVIISEVMWGLNTAPGITDQDEAQWVEIYNHGALLLSSDDLRISWHPTRPLDALGTKVAGVDLNGNGVATDTGETNRVILDRVSTIARFGGVWAAKGNSGNTAIITNPLTPITDLVSMYRKINLEAGKYKVKDGNLDGLGDGTAEGSWEASTASINMTGRFIGSPGAVQRSFGGLATTFTKNPADVAGGRIIINEVRNDTSEANLDWIELYNAGSARQDLEKFTISVVTATKNDDGTYKDHDDKDLFSFPKYRLGAGEYLVVYNRDPSVTILAGGINIEDIGQNKHVNKGAQHKYYVAEGLDIPNKGAGELLIILRNGNDKNSSGDKIEDYAGNGFFPRIEKDKFNTDIWPFVAWTTLSDTVSVGKASANRSWARKVSADADGMWVPNPRADNRSHKDDWVEDDFSGVGYDRDVDPEIAPGTPGYQNQAVGLVYNDAKGTDAIFDGTVSISEIMFDAGPRWNMVQWIELYNSSMTQSADISGWTLEIRNMSDVESYVDSSFMFDDGTEILPNQTLLLVSGTGANDVDGSARVYNLYQKHRRELGLIARSSVLLSPTGFYIRLTSKIEIDGETKTIESEDLDDLTAAQMEALVVDEVGNVQVDKATRTLMWGQPTPTPLVELFPRREDGTRQSLIRIYDTQMIDGSNDGDMPNEGTMQDSWKQSDLVGAGLTFYGHRDDIGTPGYRLGGPLPVSLSSFRPARDKATGEVVIRWVTESELNNAGFNILRSETKNGEFTVVNLKGLIPGHGTTSEKHAYEWKDTTAKPNVVYYYQIEDVSLNGNRTTLRTTHLRGNVNAAGKLTTTWGDLKTQN